MECLLEPIQCTKCFEQLKSPVVLPCGNAICEKHQEESQNETKSIYCSVCDLHHDIPNGGFVRILALGKLIQQQIDSIDMGKEYHYTYNKLKYFSDLYKTFEKLKNNPDDKVCSIIRELKNEIDLRREELKSQIDKDALSVINKLDEYEAECKANIASIKAEIEKSNKLNEWKEDLDGWQQQMRTFRKDTDMWNEIHEVSSSKFDEMNKAYIKFYKDLFLNRLDEYKNLKLFLGNDFDMTRNHSLTHIVKNVSQAIKNGDNIDLYSETFRAFGINWSLGVETSTDNDSGKSDKYVGVFLFVEGDFSKESYDVLFDIVILHRTDPSKNLTKDNMKKHYTCSTGYGSLVIKLNELINNEDFFDAENDCFKIQILIKSVEFKNIEEAKS